MAINLRIVCGLRRNVVTLSTLSTLSPSILFRFLFNEGMATKSSFSFRGWWEGRGRSRKTKGFFRSLHRIQYSNFRRTKISSINIFQQFQGISSLENLFWIFGANLVSPQPRSQGPTGNEVGVTHLFKRRPYWIWRMQKRREVFVFPRYEEICMGYWPSVRSRWLDIGQVLFLRVYGPRRSRSP